MASNRFVSALGVKRLTSLYDPVVRATTRERTFKRRLLDQAAIQPGQSVRGRARLHAAFGSLSLQSARLNPE